MSSDTKPPRILVAEDDPNLMSMLRDSLKAHGAEVMAVADGQAAVKEALLNPYDLYLLDIEMPVLDGIQACRQLRSMAFTRNVPILILTGKTDKETVDIALAAGAWDFLTKPIHTFMLWQRVTNMMELKNAREISAGIAASMEATGVRPSGYLQPPPPPSSGVIDKPRPSGIIDKTRQSGPIVRPSGYIDGSK